MATRITWSDAVNGGLQAPTLEGVAGGLPGSAWADSRRGGN